MLPGLSSRIHWMPATEPSHCFRNCKVTAKYPNRKIYFLLFQLFHDLVGYLRLPLDGWVPRLLVDSV